MDNSGYTFIDVEGVRFNLKFGIPAVRMFLEKMAGDDSIATGESLNELGIATLIHCGYINNCLVKDEVPEKKLGFFIEFVESCLVDDEIKKQLISVTDAYKNSKFTNKVLSNVKENLDEVKKKTT